MDLAAFLTFLASLNDALTADERTAAVNEHVASLTAEMSAPDALAALTALAEEVTAATNAQLDSDRTSDQALANLDAFGQVFAAVGAQTAAIEADVEAREARATELAAQILGEPPAAEGGEGGDDGEGGENQPAPDGTPAEGDEPVAPAEGEPAAAPEAAAPVAEPVAAAAPRVEPTRAMRPSARRPAAVMPVTASGSNGSLPDDIADWGLVAGANAPDLVAGQRITNSVELALAFESAVLAAADGQGGGKMKIARVGGTPQRVGFTEDRILNTDWRANQRKIDAVVASARIQARLTAAGGDFTALAAAGGPCAPTTVRYDLPTLGDDSRPVRDALVRFGADRAGVRLMPAVTLDMVEGATDFWTVANDINPGSNGPLVKPCLTMTCPDDEEAFVYAVTQCIEVGNFRAKFFAEQVEAWVRQAAVAGARKAEIRLLTSIGTSSTQVTHGQVLGTVPDVLAALDKALAVIRSSNRLGRNFPLDWLIPFWLLDQMRTDLARRLPFGTTDENYALAEAKLTMWLAQRNVTPTYILDGEAGQMFGKQGDGPVQGWPSNVVTYLYPAGTHLLLDAGELNLGIIRDSLLVETNDFRMFSEVFEGHAMHGVESWRYTLDTCPDGSSSAAIDIDPCTTGS